MNKSFLAWFRIDFGEKTGRQTTKSWVDKKDENTQKSLWKTGNKLKNSLGNALDRLPLENFHFFSFQCISSEKMQIQMANSLKFQSN